MAPPTPCNPLGDGLPQSKQPAVACRSPRRCRLTGQPRFGTAAGLVEDPEGGEQQLGGCGGVTYIVAAESVVDRLHLCWVGHPEDGLCSGSTHACVTSTARAAQPLGHAGNNRRSSKLIKLNSTTEDPTGVALTSTVSVSKSRVESETAAGHRPCCYCCSLLAHRGLKEVRKENQSVAAPAPSTAAPKSACSPPSQARQRRRAALDFGDEEPLCLFFRPR